MFSERYYRHKLSGTVIMIIKKSLFNEDDIFGTNASLPCGPQIQANVY